MYSCLIVTDDKAETEEYLKLAKQSGGIIKSSIRKGISYINYYDEYEEEFDALIYFDGKELNLSELGLIFEDVKFDTIEFYNCKHLDKITMDRIENLFKKKFEDCLDYDSCWECVHINECRKELMGE